MLTFSHFVAGPMLQRGAQAPGVHRGALSSATQGGRRSHMLTRTFRRLWNEPHSHVAAKESVIQPGPTAGPPFTYTHLFVCVCVYILKWGVNKPGCKFVLVPPCCSFHTCAFASSENPVIPSTKHSKFKNGPLGIISPTCFGMMTLL